MIGAQRAPPLIRIPRRRRLRPTNPLRRRWTRRFLPMRRPPRPCPRIWRASPKPRGTTQGLQLRQHPQSLCLRLAPIHGLSASAWPARPAGRSPGHRGFISSPAPRGPPAPNSARRPRSSAGFRLKWNFAQRSENFDRKDRHVATVLAGIRGTQGQPPEQKEAVLPEDLRR
jgi:hypothetical protein